LLEKSQVHFLMHQVCLDGKYESVGVCVCVCVCVLQTVSMKKYNAIDRISV